MNELLSQLNDITLPAEIGFELAYGWYLLLLLSALVVVSACVIWRRTRQHRLNKISQKYAREFALKALNDIENEYNENQDLKQLASQCNLLLRRYIQQTLSVTPHSQTIFFNTLAQYQTIPKDVERVLSTVIYQPNASFEARSVLNYCKDIIDTIAIKNV